MQKANFRQSEAMTDMKIPHLRVLNSISDSLQQFIPEAAPLVRMYVCGPTVYNSSHLGHARTYIAFDVIRRVLEKYFNYNVLYQMNITDIDDKIIVAARSSLLFEKYAREHTDSQENLKLCLRLVDERVSKLSEEKEKLVSDLKAARASEKDDIDTSIKETEALIDQVKAVRGELVKLGSTSGSSGAETAQVILKTCGDTLKAYLDSEFGEQVPEIKEKCDEHAKRFEAEFFKDMARIGVNPPDVMTRVTEYVPEICAFIDDLVKGGFAYESQGSVYFDTEAYKGKAEVQYPLLLKGEQQQKSEGGVAGASAAAPAAALSSSQMKQLASAEGSLSKSKPAGSESKPVGSETKPAGSEPKMGCVVPTEVSQEKKKAADFALWKKSKRGEPAWDSPWGLGRPGWHIECSVMASATQGNYLDIHGGGVDLKFPHHDNEIAQTVAYLMAQSRREKESKKSPKNSKSPKSADQSSTAHGPLGHEQCCSGFPVRSWVKYFLHSGHLNIQGLKMSKSLKNFITIGQALDIYSPRQLRLAFLLTSWCRPSNFADGLMDSAKALETKLTSLFAKSRLYMNNKAASQGLGSKSGQDLGKAAPSVDGASDIVGVYSPGQSFKMTKADRTLLDSLNKTRVDIDQGLKDNFDIPTCLTSIEKLATVAGGLIADSLSGPNQSESVGVFTLKKSLDYIDWFMTMIGIEGLSGQGASQSLGSAGESVPSSSDLAQALVDCRNLLRERSSKFKGCEKSLYEVSDTMRDEIFVKVGLKVDDDDQMGGSSWSLVSPVELQKALALKRNAKLEEEISKLQNKLNEAVKRLDKATANIQSIDDLSAKNGDETLSANQKKKLVKDLEKAKEVQAGFVEKLGSDYVSVLSKDVQQLKDQMADLEKRSM